LMAAYSFSFQGGVSHNPPQQERPRIGSHLAESLHSLCSLHRSSTCIRVRCRKHPFVQPPPTVGRFTPTIEQRHNQTCHQPNRDQDQTKSLSHRPTIILAR